MYMEHFGLNCPPFEETGNPAFFYETVAHRAARKAVTRCMREAGGVVVITGEAGMGKSMLVQCLLTQTDSAGRALSLSIPPTGATSISTQICAGLGLEVQQTDSIKRRAKRFARAILGGDEHKQRCVVFVDQAENLSLDNLRDIDALITAASTQRAHLLMVLVGRPEIEKTLGSGELTALAQNLTRTDPLRPLTEVEAGAYVRHRLTATGTRNTELFSKGALSTIVTSGRGRPRTINALCVLALTVAARRGEKEVSETAAADAVRETIGQPRAREHVASKPESRLHSASVGGALSDTGTTAATAIDKVEPLIRRMQTLIDAAPRHLAEVEDRVDSMSRRADELVRRAGDRLDALRAGGDQVEPAIVDMDRKVAEVERAKADAEQMLKSLTDLSRELVTIGQTAEERVTLLLTSLDAAQNIQDKLENLSGSVTQLVEDAERTTSNERQRLKIMFDELQGMREELSLTLEASRQEQSDSIRAAAQEITDKLTSTRHITDEARLEAARGLEDTRKVAAEIREQLKVAEEQRAAIATAEQRCARVNAETARMIEQFDNCLQEANSRATETLRTLEARIDRTADAAVEKVHRATDGVREGELRAEEAGRRLNEHIQRFDRQADESIRRAAAGMQQVDQRIEESLRRVNASFEKATDSVKQIGAEVVRANEVRGELAGKLAAVADKAEDRLNERINRAETQISDAIKRAGALKDDLIDSITTAASEAERRVNERINSVEPLLASLEPRLIELAEQANARMEGMLAAARARIDEEHQQIEQRMEALLSRSEHVQQALDEKIAGLEPRMAQVACDANDMLNATVQTARQRAEQEVAGLQHNIEALVNRAQQVERILDKKVADIEPIVGEIVREANDRLEKSHAAGQQRMDAMVQQATGRIEATVNEAHRRTAEASADLDELIAMEKSTREAAAQSLNTAKAAIGKAKECEMRLAQAQQAAIDTEASAASALASIQLEVKRAREAVQSLVAIGVDRVKDKANEASEMTRQQVEQIAATAAQIQQNVQSSVEKALARFDEHAAHSADEATQSFRKTAAGAVLRINEESNKAAQRVEQTLDECLASAPQRLEETIQRCVEQIDNFATERAAGLAETVQAKSGATIDAIETVGQEQLNRMGELIARADEKVGGALSRLAADTDGALNRLHETAGEVAKRLSEQSETTMQSLQQCTTLADETTGRVTNATRDAERATADARTGIEQINHLIRDVWSLTSTTDARARALAALASSAQNSEANLENLIQQANEKASQLGDQSAAAEKSVERLTGQQEQVRTACDAFALRIADAKKVNDKLVSANIEGAAINSQLAAARQEMGDMINTANELIETIRNDEEQIKQSSACVEQVAGAVNKLENRLGTVQESLSNPLAMIQEARAQADELNDVCLSVKRIFRGVSQASLDANERIKMLAKLLAAAERTSETMRQWVTEAGRAQDRLAAALKLAPSVADTHPLVALPEIRGSAMPDALKGTVLSATDIASMQRLARTTPQTGDRTKAPTPQRTAKPETPNPAPKQRLSPSDVQALINAAKKKVAATR